MGREYRKDDYERFEGEISNLKKRFSDRTSVLDETVLDRAIAAKEMKDFDALARIAAGELSCIGAPNMIEPLIAIADFLATNQSYIPQAAAAFVSAARWAEEGSESEKRAAQGYDYCQKAMSNASDRAAMNVMAHSSTFAFSPIWPVALGGFVESVKEMPDLEAIAALAYFSDYNNHNKEITRIIDPLYNKRIKALPNNIMGTIGRLLAVMSLPMSSDFDKWADKYISSKDRLPDHLDRLAFGIYVDRYLGKSCYMGRRDLKRDAQQDIAKYSKTDVPDVSDRVKFIDETLRDVIGKFDNDKSRLVRLKSRAPTAKTYIYSGNVVAIEQLFKTAENTSICDSSSSWFEIKKSLRDVMDYVPASQKSTDFVVAFCSGMTERASLMEKAPEEKTPEASRPVVMPGSVLGRLKQIIFPTRT